MIIKSSYVATIPETDVLSFLFDDLGSKPDTPLFIDSLYPTKRVTSNEAKTLTRKFGKGLQKIAGINVGDVVMVCAGNSIFFPIAFLGTLCAGGIFTGVNPASTVGEIAYQMRLSEAKIIITDAKRLPSVLKAANDVGLPSTAIYLFDHGKDPIAQQHNMTFVDLTKHGELDWHDIYKDDAPNRTAVLNFSSGTTGMPKGCMVSHRNLVANCVQVMVADDAANARNGKVDNAGEVHCAYVPLYHAMGLVSFCIVNVKRRCSTIVISEFSLKALLDVIGCFRVTYLLLVPPVAVQLIKSTELSNSDLSSIKLVLCGAAPLGKETSEQLETIFYPNIVRARQGWGMSEATCTVTLFARDEYDPTCAGVGYLAANMEAKIVGDDGKELGYGEKGEALLRGPNIFQGYWKNDAASKEAWTEDGWLKTGDYVVVQKNGMFAVVDRKKELIKVKGYQVAPSELESQLLESDDVKDCAVIRVIREGREYPQGHIVPSRGGVTAQTIMDFMAKKLSPHKQLAGGIVFTSAIPKSPSGKILRRLIKDPFEKSAIRQHKL
ncbi:hypothetical protein V501_00459 [Pseudogymnoascus sp. VKM F-4519 (FW-2642)]|nr:hypothetical protein V501_00459 [Pseudogymnoascus sp. VKM F-4519 (FW-2642)]